MKTNKTTKKKESVEKESAMTRKMQRWWAPPAASTCYHEELRWKTLGRHSSHCSVPLWSSWQSHVSIPLLSVSSLPLPPLPSPPPICLSLCVPFLFFLLFQLQTIPPRLQQRLFLRKHLETVNHLWINNQRRHVSQLHSVECNKRASQVIDPALFGNVAL